MGGLGGSVGGATPGKYLMGLSAIASDSVTTILTDAEGKKVRIMPGGNLGFWRYDHYLNVYVVKKKIINARHKVQCFFSCKTGVSVMVSTP